jgi:hypothetical protein
MWRSYPRHLPKNDAGVEWTDRVPAFETYSRGSEVRLWRITEEQAGKLLEISVT